MLMKNTHRLRGMIMKKKIVLLLIAATTLAVSGCGSTANETTEVTPTETVSEVSPAGRL